jgi:deazaflavin-dependent oxidoreductase (nitroreductase family)
VTTASLSPAQLTLPGQAAAPDGEVDVAAMYLMHWGFRRDLAAFAAAVPVTPVADRRAWTRLSRRFALFAGVLHKHHTGEDAGLWPLLAERGADPAVLDALEAEHAVIDPLLARCAAGLSALAAGHSDEAGRDTLAARLTELGDELGSHLGHEERDGMALVQAHLTQADWERLDREHFAPQYRARDVVPVLGWVMADLPAEAERAIPGANRPMLAAGRVLGRLRSRSDARTFSRRPTLSRADRAATWVSKHAAAAHTALLRRTGGRLGNRFRGGDVVLLTHRGRRSGRTFTTPLLYVEDGPDLVVAASNGGIDAEPQWWLNMQADPHGEVEVRGRRRPVTASVVDDGDRARLWAALMARCPTYDDYQAKVSRRIALVRLSPTEP